jgi:hypothetical protein
MREKCFPYAQSGQIDVPLAAGMRILQAGYDYASPKRERLENESSVQTRE